MSALQVLLYLSFVVFIIAVIVKVRRYQTAPVHMRWELYPVAHEKGRHQYGGSFFEESEWWEKEREIDHVNEAREMAAEILLLKGVRLNNRKLWIYSFPFHGGLYLLCGWMGLILVGAILQLVGIDQTGVIMAILRPVTSVIGYAGLALTGLGALGLFFFRVGVADMRKFNAPADYVKRFDVEKLPGPAFRKTDLAEQAKLTMRFVVDAQNVDGSWWYAAGPSGRWIDGFHSGYVLEAILEYLQRADDPLAAAAFDRGMAFFTSRLLQPDALPRYLDVNLYPIDVQNCAQAIQLLAKWSLYRKEASPVLALQAYAAICKSLLVWKAGSGKVPQAWFRMQQGRFWRNDLAAIRWGQAPMLLALRWLQLAQSGRNAHQHPPA